MKLSQLLDDVNVIKSRGDLDMDVNGISYRSNEVRQGDVFCTWKGGVRDGHDFIWDAHNRGAAAFVVEIDDPGFPEVQIMVPDGRRALGLMASNYYGKPSHQLNVVGITGTNGKTSTAFLMHHIFSEVGKNSGLLGTIEYRIGNKKLNASRTTPEGLELHGYFNEMLKASCESVIMEVSSHALDQGRVDSISFNTAVFTNLTQDHLDYHKNMEEYFQAKLKLFKSQKAGHVSAINIDDVYGRRILQETPNGVGIHTYGFSTEAGYRAQNPSYSLTGTSFEWITHNGSWEVYMPWIGQYNISNVLAAATACCANGVSEENVISALRKAPSVKGRLERITVCDSKTPAVFIDYAHTDDAVKKALQVLKPLTKGKLYVVVGCGGDRDRGKRPMMARAACDFSDFAIFTSDNPRTEKPENIVNDMIGGVARCDNYQVVLDREQAIADVIKKARQEDVILVAGKGHEETQEINGQYKKFSDREVTSRYLEIKTL